MTLRPLLTVLLLTAFTNLSAQKKDGKFIGFGAIPGLQGRVLTFKDNTPPEGYSKQQYKDSLNKADHMKASVGFHVWYSTTVNKQWGIWGGLQYLDMGFNRVKKNLQFGDVIHPEIGKVNDLAETTSKDVTFNTRYQYVNVQFLAVRRLSIKTKKTEGMAFALSMGGSLGMLVQHEVHARLKGFTAYGKKDFHISNTGYNAAPANFNLVFGARMDYALYPKTNLYIHPNLVLPLLTANYASERHHLYGINLEIGLAFSLAKKQKQ